MKEKEQKKAAKDFAERWKGKGYEKGQSQKFWIDLLENVYGVENVSEYIDFEEKVKLDHTSFIDGYIKETKVMIEQKSIDKDLRKPIKQSDGSLLTPFEQAKRYVLDLPLSKHPRWIVTCNFAEFLVYDMEKPHGEPEQIFLKDFSRDYYRMQFLVETDSETIKREMEISLKAGELVGKLYDAILKQYKDPTNAKTLKSLNILCVRLVFCLYAEDSGLFGTHEMFGKYLRRFSVSEVRHKLVELFKILDTKEEERDPYLDEDLLAFPYVNGGLFAEENIEIPRFNEEIVNLLIDNASAGFDWSEISPTIFGAVFESTLNPETRRSGGMHYTSIENIHKVIDPLFLDDLKKELEKIKEIKAAKTKITKLEQFCEKLSTLIYLDPACGSGNFLTETYISLRRLENEAIKEIYGKQILIDEDFNPIKVEISQFYGIEINDFAVTVAKTALWIAESQMMKETEEIINKNIEFLPLRSSAHITEGNALRTDWAEVVPKDKLSYIMGNPPFVGASMMTKGQKTESVNIFGKIKLSNSIDYVGAWYFKSCELINNTDIKAALVSTNSITQGEQVAPLWGTLFSKYNIQINFAYRTFRWDSEANLKAHVHCVIIGFGKSSSPYAKCIYDNGTKYIANNINAYLIDAPNVFITSRSKPICDVPKLTKGNQPTDNGNFILTEEEKNQIIKNNQSLSCCIRRYVGARDYLNNNEIRYCLWLKDISPSIYRTSKEITRRLNAIKEFREKSTATPTRKFAEKPYLFFSSPQTDENYLIIPRVSSEKRKYIPIGFMTPDIIASDSCSIICGADLYMFGILTSSVHMAWTKAVCGRLESRYRYSGSIVYNNFPWCTPTDKQKAAIEKTARGILDARALYPDCSLADLYDETSMPIELRKAHQANDKAVLQAYGFWGKLKTESEYVAELMKMYQKLTENS